MNFEMMKDLLWQGNANYSITNFIPGMASTAYQGLIIYDVCNGAFRALSTFAGAVPRFGFSAKRAPSNTKRALASGRTALWRKQQKAGQPCAKRIFSHLKSMMRANHTNVASSAYLNDVNGQTRWMVIDSIWNLSTFGFSALAIIFDWSKTAWTPDGFAEKYLFSCGGSEGAGLGITGRVLQIASQQMPRLNLFHSMAKDAMVSPGKLARNLPYYCFTAGWFRLIPQLDIGWVWMTAPLVSWVAYEGFFKERMGIYEKTPEGIKPATFSDVYNKPDAEFCGASGILTKLFVSHMGTQYMWSMRMERVQTG